MDLNINNDLNNDFYLNNNPDVNNDFYLNNNPDLNDKWFSQFLKLVVLKGEIRLLSD